MDVREKLVELIEESTGVVYGGEYGDEEICPQIDIFDEEIERIADHLIAHGVTVQKWISVSEPPEENGYYLCYVLASAVGDKVKYEQMPLYWEDDIWLYRHNSYRMCRNVTHWMPLPQPPKGE